MIASAAVDSAQAMAGENHSKQDQHDSGENTEAGGDPVLVCRGKGLVCTPFNQGEQKQAEEEDAGGMGDGDDDPEDDGIPNSSTGSHEVSGNHRFSMSGTEGMAGSVGQCEEECKEDLPQFGIPGDDGLDDVADLLFFGGSRRRVFGALPRRSAGPEDRLRIISR